MVYSRYLHFITWLPLSPYLLLLHLTFGPHVYPKIKITTWIALYDHLLTANILHQWNIALVFNCILYLSTPEISNHLLLHCSYARQVQQYFLSLYRLHFPYVAHSLWHQWRPRHVSSCIYKTWDAITLATIWCIQTERKPQIIWE